MSAFAGMCNPILSDILRAVADSIDLKSDKQRGKHMLDEDPPSGRGNVNQPSHYGPVPNEGVGPRSIL